MPEQRFLGLDSFDVTVLGFLVTVLGFSLSIAALCIAAWQLRRTAKAVEASTDAISRTEAFLATNHMLVTIPQLLRLEAELEEAAQDDDGKSVRRQLNRWRESAGELQGLLAKSEANDTDLIQALARSITLAHAAKDSLFNGEEQSLVQVSKEVRNAIGDVCIRISVLSGELKHYSERGQTADG